MDDEKRRKDPAICKSKSVMDVYHYSFSRTVQTPKGQAHCVEGRTLPEFETGIAEKQKPDHAFSPFSKKIENGRRGSQENCSSYT